MVIKEVRLENYGYNYMIPDNVDQTRGSALCQICIIGQKIK